MTRTPMLAAVVVVLAACGGGTDPTYAPSSPSPAGTSPSPTVSASPVPDRPNLSAVRVRLTPVADLDSPLAMALIPEDERLFVAGQSGNVYALEPGGSGNVPEILDLSD